MIPLILFFLFYVFLLSGLIISLATGAFILPNFILLAGKIRTDFLFLNSAAQLFKQKILMKAYLPVAILHIPYVIFFGLGGRFIKFEWGGIKQ